MTTPPTAKTLALPDNYLEGTPYSFGFASLSPGAVFGGAGLYPALLNIRCKSPEQMGLLNAFCLLVEMAGEEG